MSDGRRPTSCGCCLQKKKNNNHDDDNHNTQGLRAANPLDCGDAAEDFQGQFILQTNQLILRWLLMIMTVVLMMAKMMTMTSRLHHRLHHRKGQSTLQ